MKETRPLSEQGSLGRARTPVKPPASQELKLAGGSLIWNTHYNSSTSLAHKSNRAS